MRLLNVCVLFLLPALAISQSFTDVTMNAGIDHVYDYGDFHFGGGAAVIDYNNDGFEDLYVVGGINADGLYKNNGDGTFTDVKEGAGFDETDTLLTIGAIAGDINNDGWTDLFITTRGNTSDLNSWSYNLLFKNNGDGTFSEIGISAQISNETSFSTSAAFGDYNNDGYLDIYVLNFLGVPLYSILDSATTSGIKGADRPGSANYLFMNNGDETFTERALAESVGDFGCGWSTIFSDYDRDNDLDLYVANDFGAKTKPNELYENNYPFTGFTQKGNSSGTDAAINAMGVDAGDFNEDGLLDYYVTDLDTNILYENNGDGTFTDVTTASGVGNEGWQLSEGFCTSVGWGTNFFDYDHDSYLDLFVSNGSLNPMRIRYLDVDTFYNANTMYRNMGNSTFDDATEQTGLGNPHRGRGSVVFDYDNDGDLDLFVVNQRHYDGYGINENPKSSLYRNDNGNNGNWLKVKLEGGISNIQGIGALVEATAGSRKLIREIHAGSSHLSSSSPIVHFGLGDIQLVDTLRVYWSTGNVQESLNVGVNQQIGISESPVLSTKIGSDKSVVSIYPNPAEDVLTVHMNATQYSQVEIRIMDAKASPLVKIALEHGNNEFSIDHVVAGIYFFEVYSEGLLVERGKLTVK